jgi:transcriptional regulator with XRE-family HTH domain
MTASRQMPPRPAWLFDSMLLRQALAQVNLPAVPAIVRAACGLPQRDLASMAGWSQAALSYYERGVRDGMYDIRTALQFCDAVGVPRAALLPLILADADASPAAGTGDGTGTELSRRGLGALAAAAGLSAAIAAVPAPRQMTGSHIRYWQACTDTLYARDRSVGGTVLLPLAVQQWRRARLAVRGGSGEDEGRYLPVPRLHALTALRAASAASLLGDKAAFQRGITQARRELDRGPHDENPPEWLRFVDPTEVTGVEARGWLNLGDPALSALLYRQVLTSGLSPRNRASYGAGLADALLKQGARHDAITAATDVLPALEDGVTSIRCLNRLRLIRQAATGIPGAEEFCARFDTIERALAGPGTLIRDGMPDPEVSVPA